MQTQNVEMEEIDMAKIVDITEKLAFEEKPMLVIRKRKIKVNHDAKSVIRLMALVESDGVSEAQIVREGIDILFDENEKKKLDDMNLSLADFMTVISSAMELVSDMGGGSEGEAASRATT